MTPFQKLKHAVLLDAQQGRGEDFPIEMGEVTADNVDSLYAELCELNYHWDSMAEIRGGQAKTGLESPCSRHYESYEVAAKMPDGSWVGWTYWYGGGKHGNPDEIEWMADAYNLSMTEKEELVTKQYFTRLD